MNLVTANIKSNPLMRQSRVESDIAHAVRLGGVIFWQEIAPKRYKAALARHAELAGADVYGIDRECPVSVSRRSWVVEMSIAHLMHRGMLAVTPSRFVVETRAHERRGEHMKLCFLGTHFLSSAWSRRHMGTRKWRRKQWWIHFYKLKALVEAALADGYTVVIGMDANKSVVNMDLHPDQVVVSAHGIDGIIVIPAPGYAVHKSRERVVKGMYTDHDPVAVTATLRRRERPLAR